MPQENDLSRVEQQAALHLWVRGCVLVGVAGLLAVVMLSMTLYRVHQRPLLDATPERINPNTAPIGSLVRLEGIGRARAIDIIHYRQTHLQDGPAFQSAQDLEHIYGIGPKTVEKMSPWLRFKEEPRINTNGH